MIKNKEQDARPRGAGGYRIGGYWRISPALEVPIVAVSIPMVPWVWPL